MPNSFPDPKTPKNSARNAKDMENWVSAINSKIFLPEVIKDKYSYDVIPYMFNVPNFITSNKIMGKVNNKQTNIL